MTFFVLLLYKLYATGTMLKHGIRGNLNLCSWATSVTKLHSFLEMKNIPLCTCIFLILSSIVGCKGWLHDSAIVTGAALNIDVQASLPFAELGFLWENVWERHK